MKIPHLALSRLNFGIISIGISSVLLSLVCTLNLSFAQTKKSSTADSVVYFRQPKLMLSLRLQHNFVAKETKHQAYEEITITKNNTDDNGALWTYNRKHHNLKELLATQTNDTSLTEQSSVRRQKIGSMPSYKIDGKETTDNGEKTFARRIIIDRPDFDEFYVIYISAKTNQGLEAVYAIFSSIRALKTNE